MNVHNTFAEDNLEPTDRLFCTACAEKMVGQANGKRLSKKMKETHLQKMVLSQEMVLSVPHE